MVSVATKRSQNVVEHILSTASRHFAAKGFAGARMDEIADDAGVNKASIYYHIGNKDALYAQVFNDAFVDVAGFVQQQVNLQQDVDGQIRAYIFGLAVIFTQRRPFLARMMMREVASGGERMPAESLANMGLVQGILRKIIAHGQADNKYRDVDPFIVHMMIIGSLEFLISGEGMRKRLTANLPQHTKNAIEKTNIEDSAQEIADFIIISLRTRN
jgi:AcrR family transcriptional regulator